MPPVEGLEGAYFYTNQASVEAGRLEQKWIDGDFAARVVGKLLRSTLAGDQTDEAVVLFVPEGVDPAQAGSLLAQDQQAVFMTERTVWFHREPS